MFEKKTLKQYAQETNFKGKEYSLKLEKDLIELKDRELKDKKSRIKREIEKIFLIRLM